MAQRKDEQPAETLGVRLRIARVRMRWNLRDLSAATGIAVSLLSRYERDKLVPTTVRLQILASAFAKTVHDFGNAIASGDAAGAQAASGEMTDASGQLPAGYCP